MQEHLRLLYHNNYMRTSSNTCEVVHAHFISKMRTNPTHDGSKMVLTKDHTRIISRFLHLRSSIELHILKNKYSTQTKFLML